MSVEDEQFKNSGLPYGIYFLPLGLVLAVQIDAQVLSWNKEVGMRA